MGNVISALRDDIEDARDSVFSKPSSDWLDMLHAVGHFAIVPAVFALGLLEAGEFTLNPLVLANKLFFELSELPRTPVFSRAVYGGTFDRIHDGHRAVISTACELTRDILYIGVVDSPELLRRKAVCDSIQPLAIRMSNVRNYVSSLHLSGNLQVVVITTRDAVGPAGYLKLDAIFVTEDSYRGGVRVNEARESAGLNELKLEVVPLIYNDSGSKVSSSSIRLAEQHPQNGVSESSNVDPA